MPILRLADSPSRPWKNGLGRTREIAVHPPEAGMDDFLWRVSVAEVDSAAPFSSFPGIDRVIVLLDGAGFTMTLDGMRTHALTVPHAPFAFPGEAGVTVALAGGPTRDFNLMTRRGRVRGRVEVWREAGPLAPDADIALVYCARGAIGSTEGLLHAGDAWLPTDAATPLVLRRDTVALTVRIHDAG
jgi:environmental stress-induced protein Ves